jgi:hypothetical protein
MTNNDQSNSCYQKSVFPTTNRSQAQKQLELLGYKPEDQIYLRFFYPSDDPRKEGDKGRKADKINWQQIEQYQKEGRGAYFVINGGGHKNVDVTVGRAIFIEHDRLPKDVQKDLWKSLGLPEPTFQVDTGGKSVHGFWVFNKPATIDKWSQLQKDLLEFGDGDRSIKNPARVMRLAGAWHISHDEDGNPVHNQSKIISASGKTYSYEELREIIPSSVKSTSSSAHQKSTKKDGNGRKIPLSTEKVPLYQFLTKDDRKLIDVGAVNGTRNDSGAKLARNIIGTSERLNQLGISFTEDPYQLFLDYCNRCPSEDGWNEREWENIWKSAIATNPTPSLTDEALNNCAVAWQKKLANSSSTNNHNGHSNGRKPPQTNNGQVNGQKPPSTTNGQSNGQKPPQSKNNVVNHSKHQSAPINHDDLMAEIDQLIEKNLGESQVSIELSNLAKKFGIFEKKLENIYADRLKQLEQIEDREDTKKHIDYMLKAEHTDVDLKGCLPQEMADPLTWIAYILGSNPLSMLTILLSVVASLIDPDTKLELIKATQFYAKPILYTGIVAESGSAKSPTMKTIINPFKKLQYEADARYREQLEEYEADLKAWKATKKNDRGAEPEPPPAPREYFINDATAEGISLIQSNQPHKGFLMELDELGGLIKSANAYRGGKGTDAEKILSARDGTGTKVNRASGKRHSNPRSTFSITGGIQRDILKQQMGNLKDSQGHWARFLWAVMPIREAQFPDYEPPIYINSILEDLYRKIEALPAIDYKMSPEARDIYAQWFRKLEKSKMDEPNQALRAAYAKMKQFVGDIALLLQTIENAFYGEQESVVSARVMKIARYLSAVYIRQIKLIYGEADVEANLTPMFKKIVELSDRKGKITARDTINGVWELRSNKVSPDLVRGYFQELVHMGYGSVIGNGRRLCFRSHKNQTVENCRETVEKEESLTNQELQAVDEAPTVNQQSSTVNPEAQALSGLQTVYESPTVPLQSSTVSH